MPALQFYRKTSGDPPNGLPAWVPAAGTATTYAAGSGVLTNSLRDVTASHYNSFWTKKIVNDYSGACLAPDIGSYGAVLFAGGGHAATNDNSIITLQFSGTQASFVRLSEPTHWDVTDANNDTINITSLVDTTWGDAYPLDGTYAPACPHSYSSNIVIPAADGGATYGTYFTPWVIAGGHVQIPNSGGAHRCALNSASAPASNVWSRAGASVPSGVGGWGGPSMACHVPAQGRIYYGYRGAGAPRWFDLADDTHHTGTGAAMDSGTNDFDSGIELYVEDRGLIVRLDRVSGALRVQWMDVTVSQPTAGGTATLSTTISLKAFGGAATFWRHAFYCPDSGKIIVGKFLSSPGGSFDATGLYEITIPATLTDTWTCTRVEPGITFDWTVETWQFFVYLPAARAAVMLQAAQDTGTPDTITVYRPSGT